LSIQDHLGFAALHEASCFGHESTAQLLLSRGADTELVNEHGNTPLAIAVLNGHHAVCQLLLDHGAAINTQNKYDASPLIHATCADSEDEALVEKLLSRGAHLDIQMEKGITALMMATVLNYQRVFNLLLCRGATIDLQNDEGETALFIAWKLHHDGLLRRLCEAGANPAVRGKDGLSILEHACLRGDGEVVDFFLSQGVDVNA
jgi:ankyrin repeat protein